LTTPRALAAQTTFRKYANGIEKLQAISALANGGQHLKFRLCGSDIQIVSNTFISLEVRTRPKTREFGQCRFIENGSCSQL
jgi:hypothetical protein